MIGQSSPARGRAPRTSADAFVQGWQVAFTIFGVLTVLAAILARLVLRNGGR